MKHLILFLFALCVGRLALQGQDLVVTLTGDSINCNISKMDGKNIYFTFMEDEDIRTTMVPFQMVSSYAFNFYPGTVIPVVEPVRNNKFPHFRLGINGGLSWQTSQLALEIPSEYVNYAKKLQSGMNLSGDIYYYPSQYIGLGAKVCAFYAPADRLKYRELSYSPLAIRFYGPALSGRLLNQTRKNTYFFNIALGKVDYKIMAPMGVFQGKTLSSMFELAYDVKIYKMISLGGQLSYLAGYISTFKGSQPYGDGSYEIGGFHESLNRLDLSAGIKFSL